MSSCCGLQLEEGFASSQTPLDLSESLADEICTWKFKTLKEELRRQRGVQGAARSVPQGSPGPSLLGDGG